MPVSEIAFALRSGLSVSDAKFDAALSSRARVASSRFWTPVDVARRAAGWLENAGVERVLDVGSGVGKLCIVGALSTGMTFVGLEKRASLVAESQALARRLGVTGRAQFEHGTLREQDCDGYDAVYVFNPFAENLYHLSEMFDEDASNNVDHYVRDLGLFEKLMTRADLGFRVVTYHGCGARIPDSYDLSKSEYAGTNVLRLWTKARATHRGGFWRERFETTDLCSATGDAERTLPGWEPKVVLQTEIGDPPNRVRSRCK